MLNISSIIPDNSPNWVVKKNILYYNKFILIPLANVIDNRLFICLDKRCLNPVIKLIHKCEKMELDFLFCDRQQIFEKFIFNESIPNLISSVLHTLDDDKFFNLVNEGRIKYLERIVDFLQIYDCHNQFRKKWRHLNTYHFNRSYFDPYGHTNIYFVKRQEIREYFDTIDREVKIMLFLSDLLSE
jgi:hypothetical protein